MYQRKNPIDLTCPLRLTMSLMSSKWNCCILDELRNVELRPSEIHRRLSEAAPRVLDIQLKELERNLLPIIDSMIEWGESHRKIFDKIK